MKEPKIDKTVTCEFIVEGMHCDSCELYIEETIKKQSGIVTIAADANTRKVHLSIAQGTDIEELKKRINSQIVKQGYEIVDQLSISKRNGKEIALSAVLAFSLVAIFVLLQKLNLTAFAQNNALSYPAIVFLGVLASLSTCMAVVGGIVITLSSKFAAENRGKAIVAFHLARFFGFVLLGGVIGLMGKVIIISTSISAVLRFVIALVMAIIGLDMLGVTLPKLVLPKGIAQAFGLFDDKDGWTSAVLLGVSTFFLPCAFTQSMQLYAMTTGSFITGALVMGAFALGTLPVLALVSVGSATGAARFKKGLFGYTMGFLILFFALFNILSIASSLGIIPVAFLGV